MTIMQPIFLVGLPAQKGTDGTYNLSTSNLSCAPEMLVITQAALLLGNFATQLSRNVRIEINEENYSSPKNTNVCLKNPEKTITWGAF